mmetsp:Transcript_5981/g.6852  ORF Transcript_5981/g.6852 Transcript_5981/m.6852 type:complete len:105 (-) Transcript_5981:86-400(-)
MNVNDQDEYMVYSAGNDSKLKLWKVCIPYQGNNKSNKRKGNRSKPATTKSKSVHKPTNTESSRPSHILHLAIKLENKPNWIVPISDGRVALADTSNSVKIYSTT